MTTKIIALVPAAGTGTRLGDRLPKQYLALNGKPMIFHTLAALARVSRIARIVVVLSPDDRHWREFEADWALLGERIAVVNVGGKSRGESVANGLQAIAAEMTANDWALVHDAARPCIRTELVEQFIDELENDPIGGLLALPLADTIKRDDGALRVAKTVSREGIWRAQTPQMFRYGMLSRALRDFVDATDEAQAIEAGGHAPRLVMGDSANLKVTYAHDMKLARMLLTEDAIP
ncbi:MAG TPA: 2-C-methyl-D-erythritol 4-phosphate cytidylyltransferase [Usitatibacteraceae bacterium]